MTATIWNRKPDAGGATVILSALPPVDVPVATVWGDLYAVFFVNPDGSRDTDG